MPLSDTQKLLDLYEKEPVHSEHVTELADQLFTSLSAWHNLGDRERLWLKTAAQLHDIGWFQTPDGKGHHKESARLIRAHPWKDFPREEIEIVALIARYHRKALPSPEHEDYHGLASKHQQVVSQLGGILRVADALDRSHCQVVRSVSSIIARGTITLDVTASTGWTAERNMVLRKGDLLELVSQRKICFTT